MGLKRLLKLIIAPFAAPFYRGRGSILMFHRILPKSDRERVHNQGLEVSPEKLEEIIAYFRYKNYAFLHMSEVPHYLRSRNKRKFVVFTFDDGYEDNYRLAFPVFINHEIPFTIFITTDWPNNKAILWHYLLEDKLLACEKLDCEINGKEISLDLTSKVKKEEAFNLIRREILSTPPAKFDSKLEKLLGLTKDEMQKRSADKLISWMQLKDLVSSKFVEIGAHTVSHPALNTLSESDASDEILTSKKVLEEKLDTQIVHFAYPYGSRNEIGEREIAMVSSLPFQTAVTTRSGNIHNKHLSKLHALPRIFVHPDITYQQLESLTSGRHFFMKGAGQRIVSN